MIESAVRVPRIVSARASWVRNFIVQTARVERYRSTRARCLRAHRVVQSFGAIGPVRRISSATGRRVRVGCASVESSCWFLWFAVHWFVGVFPVRKYIIPNAPLVSTPLTHYVSAAPARNPRFFGGGVFIRRTPCVWFPKTQRRMCEWFPKTPTVSTFGHVSHRNIGGNPRGRRCPNRDTRR